MSKNNELTVNSLSEVKNSTEQERKCEKMITKWKEEIRDWSASSLNISQLKEDNYPNWKNLPSFVLLLVFKHLQIYDRAQAARVCQHWYRVYQVPQLWQSFEFIISQPQRSSLQPTSPALIRYILNQHAKHLRFVTFKVDSSQESAEMACRILAQLVDCSLKTLGLISSAKPSFMKLDPDRFVSALTLVIDKCHSLSSLAIEETPVDDPSLQLLAINSCKSLELLWMKSCPRVSAKGIQAVADHCHQLCELTLNYSLLSDDLLLALSSEEHARLKFMRIDVSADDLQAIAVHHVSSESWQALTKHSPSMSLVMYIFLSQENALHQFFNVNIPITHLYFCNYVPQTILAKVAKYCPCLTELVIGSNGNSLIDQEILSVAHSCPKLASLGLGMCEMSCSAVVELAKICGGRLKKFYALEESLIEDEQYDISRTCFEVSRIIGYEWCPDVMPVW